MATQWLTLMRRTKFKAMFLFMFPDLAHHGMRENISPLHPVGTSSSSMPLPDSGAPPTSTPLRSHRPAPSTSSSMPSPPPHHHNHHLGNSAYLPRALSSSSGRGRSSSPPPIPPPPMPSPYDHGSSAHLHHPVIKATPPPPPPPPLQQHFGQPITNGLMGSKTMIPGLPNPLEDYSDVKPGIMEMIQEEQRVSLEKKPP